MAPNSRFFKYEYLLKAWGGFWNDHNIEVHGEPEKEYYWFNTAKERDKEELRLRKLCSSHSLYLMKNNLPNDSVIVFAKSEGYLTRYRFIIQAIVKVDNKLLTVENDLGYGFWTDNELDALGVRANYMKEYKYDVCTDLPDDHELIFSTLILR